MKKSLTLSFIFVLLQGLLYAQSPDYQLINDSLAISTDPGNFYINYMKDYVDNHMDDLEESGENSILRKSLDFWIDRLPRGNGVLNPFKKYNEALLATNPYPCPLKPGQFNGNWENTGTNTTNQASGKVMDMYIVDQNNMFVGVFDGGLWKVSNGNWTCISDAFLPAGGGVQSIVVNPANANEIYFSTHVSGYDNRDLITWIYGLGVWRSIDAGVTWNIETTPSVMDDFANVKELHFAPTPLTGGVRMTLHQVVSY